MCRAHSIHEKADTGGEGRGLPFEVCPSELVFQCPEFQNRCIRIAGRPLRVDLTVRHEP